MFCPICTGISTPKWGIHFQKACNSVNTNEDYNPEIEYCECRTCGFIFASTMHSWTKEQFNNLVYNDKYTLVDPDHVIARAQNNAEFLDSTFKGLSTKPHLDYGGGTGKLSEFLRAKNGIVHHTILSIITHQCKDRFISLLPLKFLNTYLI